MYNLMIHDTETGEVHLVEENVDEYNLGKSFAKAELCEGIDRTLNWIKSEKKVVAILMEKHGVSEETAKRAVRGG